MHNGFAQIERNLMSPRRKALSILSWLTIVFGVAVFAFACVMIGISASFISSTPTGADLSLLPDLTTIGSSETEFDDSMLGALMAVTLLCLRAHPLPHQKLAAAPHP